MAYSVLCIESEPDGNGGSINRERILMPKTYTLEDAVREAVRLRDIARKLGVDEVDYCVIPYGAWIGRPDLVCVYLSEDYLL